MSLRAKDASITSIFPDLPRAKRLVKVNLTSDEFDHSVWVRALQGLANRREVHVWVAAGQPWDEHWFRYYTEKLGIPFEKELTEAQFLAEYGSCAKGYVIYDPDTVVMTRNIAITMAGLEDLLPVTPEDAPLLAAAGLPMADDLRGRFADNREAAYWAVENLWPRCNKRIIANLCVHKPIWYASSGHLVDYLVYNKVFCCDLPRNRAFRWSRDLFRKMMETAEAPGVVLNWHCVWEQEKEYVAEAAKQGFFVLCSTASPNMTVHGAVGDVNASYTQPLPKKEDCVADPNKVYVCLYNSDGDATWAMSNLHSMNWLNPKRGSFKFGWGFLPLMMKIMPGAMQFYQETKLPDDCFWGPSSGAGYTYSWAWPEDLVEKYLTDSRELLDRSGQNGCNMVNWFLQDYWREREDEPAVRREQRILGTDKCPGLVCGLGGNPYAKSYPTGQVPKLHSVHIANVGAENIKDIIRFTEECPTRPAFMFLFAQINDGIFAQIESELPLLKDHPEICILSMDEFFLTLQDAVKRGLVTEEMYEKNDQLAETWIKTPSRHRLPLYVDLTEELLDTVLDTPENCAKRISDAGYTELVSCEIEGPAINREKFTKFYVNRPVYEPDQENDVLFYCLFTVAWGVVRGGIESKGIYANERMATIAAFERECSGIADPAPFREIFDRWDKWDTVGSPDKARIVELCRAVCAETKKLSAALGDESKFTKWPPKAI